MPSSEILSEEDHARRQRLRHAIAYVSVVAAIAVVGTFFTEWPWFVIDLAILLAFAIAVAVPRSRRYLWPGGPWAPWTGVALLTCGFIIHSYAIELLRQRSDRFDVLGVRFPVGKDSLFSIGADNSVDVRLQLPADSITRWKLVMRRTKDDRFEVVTSTGVDGIQQLNPRWSAWRDRVSLGTGERKWLHKTGSPLSHDTHAVTIKSASNPLIDYRIAARETDGYVLLEWNKSVAYLKVPSNDNPAITVRNNRVLRQLPAGIRLEDLQWNTKPDPIAAANLVLFLNRAPNEAFRSIRPELAHYDFRLTSRSANWRIGSDSAIQLAPHDSVQVFSNGYRWVFGLNVVYSSGYGTGQVDVAFGKAPSFQVGWLPAAEVCAPLTRCTLISNKPLPPPIPYFDISSFGLDTSRFSFLGRVSLNDGQVDLVTPTNVYPGLGDSAVVIPAQPRYQGDAASYRLGVFRIASSGFFSLLATLVGLSALLTGLSLLPPARSYYRTLLSQNSIAVNTAWAFASIGVVLLGVRIALGYRVTYAGPYADRGADTAIGLAITMLLVTAALLMWKSWAPSVIRWMLKVERFLVPLPTAALIHWKEERREVAETTPAQSNQWIVALGLCAFGIAVVSVYRPIAMSAAIILTGLILTCWIVLEYLGSQQTEASIALSPAEVIGMEQPDPDPARVGALVLMSAGIPLSLASPLALLASLTLLVLTLLLAAFFRKRTNHRVGALVVVSVLILVFNGAILRLPGPALLFVGVFFLFLLAIRLGHHISAAVYDQQRFVALFALAVLSFAMSTVLRVDFGLVLVIGFPLIIAFVITLRRGTVPRPAITWPALIITFGVASWFLVVPVLHPGAKGLNTNVAPDSTRAAFEKLGGPLRNAPMADLPVRRSVVRALAAQHPSELELALARTAPSPTRDQIIPALEQIWGGRAYAASGWTGMGLANQTAIGRGIAVPVSYAENTFSVYVLAEHGFLGGLLILACYLTLVVIAAAFVLSVIRQSERFPAPNNTSIAVVVGATLLLAVPAFYVAAANVAAVPLTGQNMPFLGLNAWSDAVFVAALYSAILAMLLDTLALDQRA
jgi:hypothetical protein